MNIADAHGQGAAYRRHIFQAEKIAETTPLGACRSVVKGHRSGLRPASAATVLVQLEHKVSVSGYAGFYMVYDGAERRAACGLLCMQRGNDSNGPRRRITLLV